MCSRVSAAASCRADRLEHLRAVVAGAEEDAVDDALEERAQRVEQHEHRQREEHGKRRRVA